MGFNLPGSSVHGILQARILERVAMLYGYKKWGGIKKLWELMSILIALVVVLVSQVYECVHPH